MNISTLRTLKLHQHLESELSDETLSIRRPTILRRQNASSTAGSVTALTRVAFAAGEAALRHSTSASSMNSGVAPWATRIASDNMPRSRSVSLSTSAWVLLSRLKTMPGYSGSRTETSITSERKPVPAIQPPSTQKPGAPGTSSGSRP